MAITRTDWPKLLRELEAKGLSLPVIAAALKVARSAPYWWRDNGGEPLHSTGHALLALHAQVCGIQHFESNAAHSRARNAVTTEGVDDESESHKG